MQARNLVPTTIDQYTYAMRCVMEVLSPDLDVKAIRPEHIERVVVALKQRGWKPASVSSVYRPWRALMGWALDRDLIAVNPFAKTRAPVVPVVPPPAIPVDDMRRLLSTCKSASRHNYRGVRDEAILRIFATTGLRLAELTSVTLNDVSGDFEGITVLGKGRKVRTVPLDPPTSAALRLYVTRERVRSPYAHTDRLWLAPKGPMTESGVAQMVTDRGRRVGLAIHPHSLRHYAIQAMLGAGLSEGDTMAVSGHSTRSMLDRYSAATRAERARDAFLAAPRAAL